MTTFKKLVLSCLLVGAQTLLADNSLISICNHTDGAVRVAAGYRSKDETKSRSTGWRTIGAGECANDAYMSLTTLTKFENFYLRAESEAKDLVWSGPTQFCTTPKGGFDLANQATCEEGQALAGFKRWNGDKENSLIVLSKENAGETTEFVAPTQTIKICNHAPGTIQSYLGYRASADGVWLTEAVDKLEKGTCTVLKRSVAGEQVFVAASLSTPQGTLHWNGKTQLCAASGKFTSFADRETCGDNGALLPFREVALKDGNAETQFRPQDATLANRLLRICSEREQLGQEGNVYAALATPYASKPGQFKTHGWYKVHRESCTVLDAVDATTDTVYVHFAQGKIGGPATFAGPATEKKSLCVWDLGKFLIAGPDYTDCNKELQYFAPFQTWTLKDGMNTLRLR